MTTTTAPSQAIHAPCEFDPEFLADLPYDPSVLMFDRILELDAEASRVTCQMPTDRSIPFTDQQRAHPERHPRHVAGAALVHATGMLGFVHAHVVRYAFEFRHEGDLCYEGDQSAIWVKTG